MADVQKRSVDESSSTSIKESSKKSREDDKSESVKKRKHSSKSSSSESGEYSSDSDREDVKAMRSRIHKVEKKHKNDNKKSSSGSSSDSDNDKKTSRKQKKSSKSDDEDRYQRRNRSRSADRRRDDYYSDKRNSYYGVQGREDREDRPRNYNDRDSSRTDRSRRNRDERSRSPVKTKETEAVKIKKTVDLLTSKTGGAYIPPAKLRMMQAEITDKSSEAYQRISWEALKKSIHGFINKVNVDNIGIVTRELLKENIVRGRGLLCRSIIQAQAASPTFTHVYAALVSIINSKFPNIGELLLKRLVIQFRRGFRRNDKTTCVTASKFIAHLVNQRIAHEIIALEILTLLVETPTDDSVEVAIAFLKECGQKLTEVTGKGVNAIFEMLKNILHEGKLEQRVQYMIEVIFQIRKDGFKDHVPVLEQLELVEEDDQFTHLIMLEEATETQDILSKNKHSNTIDKITNNSILIILDVFKVDPEYEANENKYKTLSSELLGSDAENSDSDSSGSDDDSDSDNSDKAEASAETTTIIDNTETNLIALRRTIYLTIHSSLDFEECAHKLMKMQLKPGQEGELCHMFLDCCAEQRTYEKFYGLLAQRFCTINKIYTERFEEIFKDIYDTTHRLDTNRLRNVSKFFAHLLHSDSIGWNVFECIKMNEDDTTSSSRVFIKILFQELAEFMGIKKFNGRLQDATLQEYFTGLFPRDNPRDTRFSINFFTSIGLGGLTDELREHLKLVSKKK